MLKGSGLLGLFHGDEAEVWLKSKKILEWVVGVIPRFNTRVHPRSIIERNEERTDAMYI